MPSLRAKWTWLTPVPATGARQKRGLLGPIPVSLCACLSPPHPSRPWHSNQCPLTSHLAISVNQLKLARCHKNIYTFYAIDKFKSSSCALLPRKLHSTLDCPGRGYPPWCQAGLGRLEQLRPGPPLPTDPPWRLPRPTLTLALNHARHTYTHTGLPPPSKTYTMWGGGREGGREIGWIKKSSKITFLCVRIFLVAPSLQGQTFYPPPSPPPNPGHEKIQF